LEAPASTPVRCRGVVVHSEEGVLEDLLKSVKESLRLDVVGEVRRQDVLYVLRIRDLNAPPA
jgi:hypothetical protein